MNDAYLVLKTAHSLLGKPPQALNDDESRQIRALVARQRAMEQAVLASAEARDLSVPGARLTAALVEIRGRYEAEEAFLNDLRRNDLDMDEFLLSLERELLVEAVLEKVEARAERVSEIDIELYYRLHAERFRRPETREARQILITINAAFAENSRPAAMARIRALRSLLTQQPERFEALARRHSECPSALHGGRLGEVTQGTLFPQLEASLFSLAVGQLSPILESPLGLHLMRCENITPAGFVSLDQASETIRRRLEARSKQVCRKAWLKQLLAAPERREGADDADPESADKRTD